MKELEKFLGNLKVTEEIIKEIKTLVETDNLDYFKEKVSDYSIDELNYLTKRMVNYYQPDINFNSKITYIAEKYAKLTKENEIFKNIYKFINDNLNYCGIGYEFFEDLLLLVPLYRRTIASKLYENKVVENNLYNKVLELHEQYKEYPQLQLFFLMFSIYIEE